jgi:hypothetical protein
MVDWTCNVYQREDNSDCHRGRQRLPAAAAELETLRAEGGDRLRSETLATTHAAHEVASNALVRPGSFDTSSTSLATSLNTKDRSVQHQNVTWQA